MILLFVFIRTADIIHIKIDEYNKNRNKMPVIKGSWYFFHDEGLKVSNGYLTSVLDDFYSDNVIIGRIRCIPVGYLLPNCSFRKCHQYPILKSGFVASWDCVSRFQFNSSFEYDFGLSNPNSTFFDDMRFHFFSPLHHTRGNNFLVSTRTEMDFDPRFLHIMGISFVGLMSPFTRVQYYLGIGFVFNLTLHRYTNNINLFCSNLTEHVLFPPLYYMNTIDIPVKCF